jgi:hypothetical protein
MLLETPFTDRGSIIGLLLLAMMPLLMAEL